MGRAEEVPKAEPLAVVAAVVAAVAAEGATAAVVAVAAEAVAAGDRDFQIFTDQSREDERTRSPRSTGPRAWWKSRDMTGAKCPRYEILDSTPAFAPAWSYRWQGNIVPSSVPTRKYVGSACGKAMQVGAKSSDLAGGGVASSSSSEGWASMSTLHEQTTPSVEQLTMLFAFWVPTMATE